MRYRKLSLLLVISLVFLLLISLVLICTWFYYYFYKTEENSSITRYESMDSLSAIYTHDSLQKLYSTTLNSSDTAWGKADTSVTGIGPALADYQRLKNEISRLLKQNSTRAELDTARVRITLLQQKIEELKNRTKAVENENKKLNEIVRQLSRQVKEEESFRPLSIGSTSQPSIKLPGVSVTLTDLQLEIRPGSDDGTPGTLAGNFKLKSPASVSGAVYVIVLQPDKRILLNSDWETGSFQTAKGKRIYSAKIPVRLDKGENNSYSFTLSLDNPEKGVYSAEMYFEGILIGKGTGTW